MKKCISFLFLILLLIISGCDSINIFEKPKVTPSVNNFTLQIEEGRNQSFRTIENNEIIDLPILDPTFKTQISGIESLVEKKAESSNDKVCDYYLTSSSNFLYCLQISNPSSYEIKAVIINDILYEQRDFLEQSTNEIIYIKTNNISTPGEYTHTLDSVSFYDKKDNKNKEAKIECEQNIIIGVKYENIFEITYLNEQITRYSYQAILNLKIKEEVDNISYKAYLYDGTNVNIIDNLEIVEGDNEINLSSLNSQTKYQIAIVATYDKLDEKGMYNHLISLKEFQTKGELSFIECNVNSIEISYDITKAIDLPDDKQYEIEGIYLLDKDDNVINRYENDCLKIGGLRSNTEYQIRLYYKEKTAMYYKYDVYYFKTKEKEISTVLNNYVSSNNSIDLDMIITDIDNTILSKKISLYKDENLIKEYENIDNVVFSSLLSNTQYLLITQYTYDLNDGSEKVVIVEETQVATQPQEIIINSIKVLNELPVYVGEEIQIRVVFDIFDDLEIKKIKINNQDTIILDLSKNSIVCTMVPSSEGGIYNVVVTEINYVGIDGEKSFQYSSHLISDFIKISGEINLIDIYFDNEYDYICPEKESKINIIITNPTLFEIKTIALLYNNDLVVHKIGSSNLVEESLYTIDYLGPSTWSKDSMYIDIKVSYIEYVNNGDIIKKYFHDFQKTFISLKDENRYYINNKVDFYTMEDGKIYILSTDIDFENDNYISRDFYRILDGDGNKIINLLIRREANDDNVQNYGLFKNVYGLITDLEIYEGYFQIKTNGLTNVGLLCTNNNFIIKNCKVSGTINFTGKGNISGLCASVNFVENCETRVKIIAKLTDSSNVGGLCCINYEKITNCIVDNTLDIYSQSLCNISSLTCLSYNSINSIISTSNIKYIGPGNVSSIVNKTTSSVSNCSIKDMMYLEGFINASIVVNYSLSNVDSCFINCDVIIKNSAQLSIIGYFISDICKNILLDGKYIADNSSNISYTSIIDNLDIYENIYYLQEMSVQVNSSEVSTKNCTMCKESEIINPEFYKNKLHFNEEYWILPLEELKIFPELK